jgi:hypothetical protein
MKLGHTVRRSLPALAGFAGLALCTSLAFATQEPNGTKFRPYIFQDCPISTVTFVDAYPALVSIEDANTICPSGFANLHDWDLSTDGGATSMLFNNGDPFKFSALLTITGEKDGEAGLRLSPWYDANGVEGRFNVRSTDGEIAVFGGRLPFYNFTATYGIHYVKGTTIYLEFTYAPNSLSSSDPGTIEYRVIYNGHLYTSGPKPFDQGNPAEDPPHGQWGLLTGGTGGGYLQSFIAGGTPGGVKATWEDQKFLKFEPVPATASTWGKVKNTYR